MSFYTLSKIQRAQLVIEIYNDILADIRYNTTEKVLLYFNDDDTYIRKAAYLNIGKIYLNHKEFAITTIALLHKLLLSEEYKIRQTVINAAGEIGKKDFAIVEIFFDTAFSSKCCYWFYKKDERKKSSACFTMGTKIFASPR